jgi:hypothetical protein
MSVTIDGVRIGELDLLTTCTHLSELRYSLSPNTLQITTAPKPFLACCLQQPFPSYGFNNEGSSASRRSRRYCPANIPQLNSFLHSQTFKLNWIDISSVPPLQSSTDSVSYFTTGGLPPVSSSWPHVRPTTRNLFQSNPCGNSPYVTFLSDETMDFSLISHTQRVTGNSSFCTTHK